MEITNKEQLNYDKAMELVITGEVAKLFTDKELKTAMRLIITNAVVSNGHTVDAETKTTVRLTSVPDDTNLRLQARLKRGDIEC